MLHYVQNLESYLNRDVGVLKKGDSSTAKLHPDLIARGWSGGEFVRWVTDGTGDHCVNLANGLASGFLLFGSNESGDGFTSSWSQNQTYGYVTICFGGWFAYTRTFETQTYVSRNGLGPAASLTYTANRPLYISENGKLTTEDESNVALNPTGLFPDGSPITFPFQPVGICMVPPSTNSNGYLGFQTMM